MGLPSFHFFVTGVHSPIHSIPTIAIRVNLTATLTAILDQLQNEHDIVLDLSLKQMVDRYFSYLDASCASAELLHSRGAWLLQYATAVRSHLLDAKYKRERHSTTEAPISDCDFLNKVTMLISAAQAYAQHPMANQGDEAGVPPLLNTILDLVGQVTPDTASSLYRDLADKTVTLTYLFTVLAHCNTEQDNPEFGMILSLIELRHGMEHYIRTLRQGP